MKLHYIGQKCERPHEVYTLRAQPPLDTSYSEKLLAQAAVALYKAQQREVMFRSVPPPQVLFTVTVAEMQERELSLDLLFLEKRALYMHAAQRSAIMSNYDSYHLTPRHYGSYTIHHDEAPLPMYCIVAILQHSYGSPRYRYLP